VENVLKNWKKYFKSEEIDEESEKMKLIMFRTKSGRVAKLAYTL